MQYAVIQEHCLASFDSCTVMASDGGASSMITENSEISDPFEILIEKLALNDKVVCKSQQKDEVDLTTNEKIRILTEILNQSKAKFLFRFGQFLNKDELQLFEQFQYNPDSGYEIAFHLQHINRLNSPKCVKNRRYAAVKRLSNDYFSEKEMRKRNPLLYDQLIGLYLSAREKKIRDMQEQNESEKTLVGVLMSGIDKEETEIKRIKLEEAEDNAMEMEDSDSNSSTHEQLPSTSTFIKTDSNREKAQPRLFWGEIQSETEPKRIKKPVTDAQLSITAQERNLLKGEFYHTMLESFLEGKDDYDYSGIDNNEEYDNLDIVHHDEEEKYFDGEDEEEVEDVDLQQANSDNETSEDDLERYMNKINEHISIGELAQGIKKL